MFNYDNIGEKIKSWAKWIAIVESVLSVIGGILVMANEVDLIGADSWVFMGPLLMILGPITAWVSSWLLYGFGELISTTSSNNLFLRSISQSIRKDIPNPNNNTETSNGSISQNIKKDTPNQKDNTRTSIFSLMRCPSCNKLILANSKFCEVCGAPINDDK